MKLQFQYVFNYNFAFLSTLDANIEEKFNPHDNIHITSLLVESGFLWIGTSSGATLIYRIPPLNGLPILNSRPFLAGDGHSGAVRVLVSVQTQIDKTSARFEEFIKEERERNIAGSYNTPEANATKTLTSAAQPTPTPAAEIDSSALPRVEQVIKKLELGKEFLKSEKEALPQPQRPVPKPRLKKMKKKAAALEATKKSKETKEKVQEAKKNESAAPSVVPTSLPLVPVTEFSSDSTVVSPVAVTITDFEGQKETEKAEAKIEDDHIYEIPQKPPEGTESAGDTSNPVPKEAQPYEDPASTLKAGGGGKEADAAGAYEVPKSTLTKNDDRPREKPTPKLRKKIKETIEREDPDPPGKEEEAEIEEAEYDEVPREDIELSGNELEARQNLKSSSDIVITPSRYEGDQILSGEAIYEHIQSSTISMAIPGRQVLPTSSSSFVFSGGDGLINFRQGQQDSVLQQVALTTHSGRDAFKNGCPCIITFQVPETNTP